MKKVIATKLYCTVFSLLSLLTTAQSGTRFISHRGEFSAPENTMPAFEQAIARGANGFECDVYLTTDNQIVCIHDATTTRTTDGNLTVASSTLAELKALDAGSWKGAQYAGVRIPTLSEALKLARDDFEIYVEIKSGTQIVPYLKQVVEAEPRATPARILFIAFNQSVVAQLRQQMPAYRTYWLSNLGVDGNSAPTPSAASVLATLQSIDASGIDIQDNSVLTSEYVETIKSAGYSFHVWTVNTVARGTALAAMGVDTVTSDYGATLTEMLGVSSKPLQPLIHWTFDGNNATNIGYGGATYDAILKGSEYQYVTGVSGQGLHVFGDQTAATRGYAEVAHVYGNQGSVAFWYNPNKFYDYNSILDNSVDANCWEFWIYSTGMPRFRVKGTSGDLYYYTNLTQVANGTNTWYHFAITWDRDAGTSYMYVNGACVTNAPISEWQAPGDKIFFGGGHSGNNPGKGIFDDVRVYEAALSAAEISAVHAKLAAQKPVVHITLNNATNNTGTGGNRYDASIYTPTPIWTNGVNRKGQALCLDGSTNYVAIPYRLSQGAGTVALWCYTPSPWYNYNSIFDNSVGGDDYECWVNVDGSLEFRVLASKDKATYALGAESNRWHYIVCTWDRNTGEMALFTDGVERKRIFSINSVDWKLPGNNFYLGGGHRDNTFARNFSSDVQIFETALSAAKVKNLYKNYYRERGGLVAWLPLDGTLEDVAGSNAVVALGSAPTFVKTQIGRGIAYQPEETPGTGGSCIAVSNVLGSCDGAISLWFHVPADLYNFMPLFDNEVHDNYWECWLDLNGTLSARVTNKGNSGQVGYGIKNLAGPDNWYHVTWVWNLAEAWSRIYINGVRRQSVRLNEDGWIDPNTTLNIGSWQANNKAANGIWDEVRVYNRALTDEEVAELAIIPPALPATGTLIMLE